MSLHWESCFYMSFGRVVLEVQLLLEAGMEDCLFWLPINFGNEWVNIIPAFCLLVCLLLLSKACCSFSISGFGQGRVTKGQSASFQCHLLGTLWICELADIIPVKSSPWPITWHPDTNDLMVKVLFGLNIPEGSDPVILDSVFGQITVVAGAWGRGETPCGI